MVTHIINIFSSQNYFQNTVDWMCTLIIPKYIWTLSIKKFLRKYISWVFFNNYLLLYNKDCILTLCTRSGLNPTEKDTKKSMASYEQLSIFGFSKTNLAVSFFFAKLKQLHTIIIYSFMLLLLYTVVCP